ncbi:MAG: Druantia anti-phage system protein DruA, partial [Fidelibacterota bacterium]
NRKKPDQIDIDESPLSCSLKDILPIRLEQVRRTHFEKMFNSLINQYHYLGYTQPVGEHLKYLAFFQDRPIACLAWGSAPWHIGARDRFIGWTKEIRQKNLHMIANNIRFLILPWIQISCLASHLLALNRQHVSLHWQHLYNHPIHLLETFVDTEKFQGTCYRADNWIQVGETTGRGKNGPNKRVLSIKAIYVYPLTKYFRRELCYDA